MPLWLNGSIVVSHAGDSELESQSVPYVLFIFHSVYPVRDTVRVRVSIFGLGIAYLAYDSTAGRPVVS